MKILEVLNKKWVLPLLNIFWNDPSPLRFSELEIKMKEEANEKISAKVLSERLSELASLAIIVREKDFFNPKYVQYYLTDYGHELKNLIKYIQNYEDELHNSDRLEFYEELKFKESAPALS
ncbi:MAG: winged helix-turn-helix transcriptional regulator [Candidatus Hodarchaeales archaeon]